MSLEMFKWIVTITIILIILLTILFCYSACILSGWISRDEENKQLVEEIKNKSDVLSSLSDLERKTVDEIKEYMRKDNIYK